MTTSVNGRKYRFKEAILTPKVSWAENTAYKSYINTHLARPSRENYISGFWFYLNSPNPSSSFLLLFATVLVFF